MKKILVFISIFLFVFFIFHLNAYASTVSLDTLECPAPNANYAVSSDNYLVWYNTVNSTYYVWFLSSVSKIQYKYGSEINGFDFYDAYGKVYSLDSTLSKYTLLSNGWDNLETLYNNTSSNSAYLVYSTHVRYNLTDNSLFMIRGYQSGVTVPTVPDDSTDEETKGLLGTIISSISDIITNIKNGFSNLAMSFTNSINTLGTNIISGISSFLETIKTTCSNIFEKIKDIPNSISELGTNLLDGIKEFFKGLFIPNENYIETKKTQIESAFSNMLGFNVSTVQTLFDSVNVSEKMLVGDTNTININNYTFSFKAFDNKVLLDGINKFKSIIRGFVALMLVFFNLNQLLNIIGQSSLTSMSSYVDKQSKGGKE